MSQHTYMSIEDTAKYYNLSVSTIRNWINDGRLPPHCYFKAGGVYRIARERADAALMLPNPNAPDEPVVVEEAPADLAPFMEEPVEEPVKAPPQAEIKLESIFDEYDEEDL